MMRLQKMRKSKDTQSFGSDNNGTLSDDDKIRLQLSIDVDTFGKKVNMNWRTLFTI